MVDLGGIGIDIEIAGIDPQTNRVATSQRVHLTVKNGPAKDLLDKGFTGPAPCFGSFLLFPGDAKKTWTAVITDAIRVESNFSGAKRSAAPPGMRHSACTLPTWGHSVWPLPCKRCSMAMPKERMAARATAEEAVRALQRCHCDEISLFSLET